VSAYGQFCPAFRAMELLGERWTMLVVRELLLGSRHFNQLRPIVDALGAWGVRWIPELGEEDLDPHLLLWDMHRNVDLTAVPAGRTTIQFTFRDVVGPARAWWITIMGDEVDVCDFDPGYPVTVTVETGLRTLVEVWRGDLSWSGALHSGALALDGPGPARRAFPGWFRLSGFAAVPRQARTSR